MAPAALITGASGLLGSWTLHHWDLAGMRPVAVRSSDVDLLRPDAAADLLSRTSPAAVVHLAWCASGQPDYRTSGDNERWLSASVELAQACARSGIPLWLTGTAVDDTEGQDAYTRAKAALRQKLRAEIEGDAVGWLRPFYVFDEQQRRPGLVQHALRARDESRPAELQSPDSRHDFVHASDVGRAIVSAVAHGLTGVVPIGSGRVRRVAELVDALGVPWHSGSRSEPAHTHLDVAADISRLRAIGWKPSRTEEFFGHD